MKSARRASSSGKGVNPVRALDRGLAILGCLQERRGATLHELHSILDLPKPTIFRLLHTLEDRGFVWRGMGDQQYHASYLLKLLSERLAPPDRLVEVAGPVLDWLVGRIHWPSDLSIRNGSFMQLHETSRLHSYFLLHRLQIGFRINMALSAPGRAYLAFCPEKERQAILGLLRRRRDAGYARIGGQEAMARILEETRRRGYSIRDPHWGGHFSEDRSSYDDGLMAIAVPIMSDGRILGCLNIVWIRRLFKPLDIAKQHLGDLKQAASLIATRYSAPISVRS